MRVNVRMYVVSHRGDEETIRPTTFAFEVSSVEEIVKVEVENEWCFLYTVERRP